MQRIDWSFIADELRRKREAQPVIDWRSFFEELERRKAAQRFVYNQPFRTLENEDYTYGHSEHNQPQ